MVRTRQVGGAGLSSRVVRSLVSSPLRDERSWRRTVLVVAVLALVVRLAIAAVTGGGNDLKIYYAFSSLAADGHNPYDTPAGFPVPDRLSDNLPVEYLVFAGLLQIADSPDSLRVLFALADAGVVLLVGLLYPRPIAWRAAFVAFYAFNPLVLGTWTATSQDKTIVFGLMAATLLALEQRRHVASWGPAAVLGVFKGVSLFFAPFLAWETWRERGLRVAALCAAGFGLVMLAGHLPWFPDGFGVYGQRSDHAEFREPSHAAFTQLLDRAGAYDSALVQVGTPLLLAAVFGAYLLRRIDAREGIVLAGLATLVLQPDHSYTRALLGALPFLLLIDGTPRRWALLWAVSVVASVGIYAQQEQDALGGYGSLPHVFVSNAFLVLVLVFYVRDKAAAGRSGVVGAARPAATGA